jgi:hypothetical protein
MDGRVGFDEMSALIRSEFSAARRARETGNEGMVRVCARRAAGIAILYWLQRHQGRQWGMDAMSRLKGLQAEEGTQADIRGAAGRLVQRITPGFVPAHTNDPLDDAILIVRSLTGMVLPSGLSER